MADSGFSSSSPLSDLNSRNSPPASLLRDDGEDLMEGGSEAGEGSPQSPASPMDRSVAGSQTLSISTIAAPGAWNQHQHQHRGEELEQLPPSPTESQFTAAPNALVDLVAGAGSRAYRALGFDSASSLSGSTPSPGPRWERETEYVTEEVIVPDARRLDRHSDRKREKARAVEPDMDPLPVSPPHGSRSTRRTQAEEAGGSKPKTDEKVRRRRRRVHYYSYTTDSGHLEYGFSRDFFLIVWLCLGIACFLILVGRSVRANAAGLDFETLL